ncbi:hypothetical protein H4R34_005264 [Dimargaris verticillata]|uniref:Uncharacterized protein n=1 Tax=Dimargaris verticillata TaxID=2761393 RepID=A0A9W8EBE5_9FUNG|nr:hypothetical protein H4R34_005264 [Dimargaris verticillata]
MSDPTVTPAAMPRPSDAPDTDGTTQRQAELRKQIQAIMTDPSISPAEKPRRIQALLHPKRANDKAAESTGQSPVSSDTTQYPDGMAITEQDLVPTFQSDTVLGCPHYMRGAKMYTECCQRWYTCRLCHNEAEDHEIDRFAVKWMMCMYCQKVQPAGQVCHSEPCQKTLGHYYCNVCHFWSDSPNQSLYHCQECGICRVGPEEDFRHCSKCKCCISHDAWDDHRCIENTLDSDCPICGEFLFTSKQSATFMKCGHAIHQDCLRQYLDTSYQCPICRKTLGDMDALFRQIDRVLAEQPMPPEYQKMRSQIFCNDCEERSTTQYHFLYHKCQHCRSYSTKVLSTFTVNGSDGPSSTD